MYAIRITPESVGFIGEYLNDSIVPEVTEEQRFFVVGVFDGEKVHSIFSAKECDDTFGPPPIPMEIPIYKIGP